MIDNKYFEKTIERMVIQAKVFLEEMREFYPYAIIVDQDGNLRSLTMQLEDDNPPSNLLIEILEKQILIGVKNGDYLIGSLGVDVVMDQNNNKTDAIEFRTIFKGQSKWGYVYLSYSVEGEKIRYSNLTAF